MNDPHVVALWYRIEHGDSLDYGKVQPLDHVETGFRVKAEQGRVCFEFKNHYATEDAAREAIEDYIRVWEFDAGLQGGPDSFKLTFDRAQITDRKPPPPVPGVVVLTAAVSSTRARTTTAKLVVGRNYPSPPSGLRLTPDVQTMYDRFQGYRLGREPLASMAYFCVTVLEGQTRKKTPQGSQEIWNTAGCAQQARRAFQRERRSASEEGDRPGH